MNSFPYDKKEDAEAAAQDALINYKYPFCPQIKDTCRFDCASFKEPDVRHTYKHNGIDNKAWGFHGPRCINAMVTGYMEFTPE